MSFWSGGAAVSSANLERLGPFCNGIVGTDGKYSVLNDAIAAGWTTIILASGASLNADLTIAAKTSIIRLGARMTLTGNYAINVTAADCYFEGFVVSNNAGKGFYVTGGRAEFVRMGALSCLSHGFHFNAASGDHEMRGCYAYANGGDGVRLEASNNARIVSLRSQSNTGWGLNDVANTVQLSCSKLTSNTAGNVSSTSTYIDASVKDS